MRLTIHATGPVGQDVTIMLDEQDISAYVRSVELRMAANEATIATVEFYTHDGFDIDIYLDDEKGLKGKRIDLDKGRREKAKR